MIIFQKMIRRLADFWVKQGRIVLDYGSPKDEIEAGLSSGFHDIYDAYCHVDALHKFRPQRDKFQHLVDSQVSEKRFTSELLKENAEKELGILLNQAQNQFAQGVQSYVKPCALIAKLQPALAALFDQVKKLDDKDDVRFNRLSLLQRVFGLFGQLLDFNKIQA